MTQLYIYLRYKIYIPNRLEFLLTIQTEENQLFNVMCTRDAASFVQKDIFLCTFSFILFYIKKICLYSPVFVSVQ